MNDVKRLIRIVFGIAAGYIVLANITELIRAFPSYSHADIMTVISYTVITLAVLSFIVWQFAIKPDKWIAKVLANVESNPISSNIDWLTVSYRLAAVIAGMILLYSLMMSMLSLPITFMMLNANFKSADQNQLKTILFLLGGGAFYGGIAIWFLFGAPQLVRWHIKEIRKLAAEKTVKE